MDWIDQSGRTYDAVGGFEGKYFDQEWRSLQSQILRHMGKADFVPVDVSGFAPERAFRVQEFVDNLDGRAFTVG